MLAEAASKDKLKAVQSTESVFGSILKFLRGLYCGLS
jgi:hypothetical protein